LSQVLVMMRSLWLCGWLLVLVPVNATAEEPRIAYWLHCAGCHGLQGLGAPPEVPSLIDEPGRIVQLPGGREYMVAIPGVSQAGLNDVELAKVLNYMMHEFSPRTLPAEFEPFSADEVGRFRAEALIDPLLRREQLLSGAAD
jgi:hypothetical protein